MPDETAAADTSPYAPPAEIELVAERQCPGCGETMEEGDVTSSSTIRWRSHSKGLQNFLTGGPKLGRPRSGFGYRLSASFCEGCGIVILKR
ncbi:MAG: PF20097 family protein [Planctomycetota bacterium]